MIMKKFIIITSTALAAIGTAIIIIAKKESEADYARTGQRR